MRRNRSCAGIVEFFSDPILGPTPFLLLESLAVHLRAQLSKLFDRAAAEWPFGGNRANRARRRSPPRRPARPMLGQQQLSLVYRQIQHVAFLVG